MLENCIQDTLELDVKVNAFTKIEQACIKAKQNNLKIERRAWFTWTGEGREILLACDAIGALLWANNLHKSDNRIADLCRLLDVDTWWLHRFWLGWEGTILQFKENDISKLEPDKVCKKAFELSKKFL